MSRHFQVSCYLLSPDQFCCPWALGIILCLTFPKSSRICSSNLNSQWSFQFIKLIDNSGCCCCCCSVTQVCPTLCNPLDCSTPGFPVLHLSEFAQTHVHWVDDAKQPCHPLLPPSPPALNLSQHQGLFQWVNSTSGGQSIGASSNEQTIQVKNF